MTKLSSDPNPDKGKVTTTETKKMPAKALSEPTPICENCGHASVRHGVCYKCLNCGNSLGCN